MAGQWRDQADDGSYRVTIGSVDDPKYPDDSYFVSQQNGDNSQHSTTIFDSQHNIIGQSGD